MDRPNLAFVSSNGAPEKRCEPEASAKFGECGGAAASRAISRNRQGRDASNHPGKIGQASAVCEQYSSIYRRHIFAVGSNGSAAGVHQRRKYLAGTRYYAETRNGDPRRDGREPSSAH